MNSKDFGIWLIILFGFFPILNAYSSTSSIKILDRPQSIRVGENFSISLEPQDSSLTLNHCFFHYDNIPQGTLTLEKQEMGKVLSLQNLPTSLHKYQIRLTPFSSSNRPWSVGNLYYIVSCTTSQSDTAISQEYSLNIYSDQKPVVYSASQSKTPFWSWKPVPDIPAYHTALLENVQYSKQTTRIQSAKLLWQAITPNTHIQYGSPDPSNNFQNPWFPLFTHFSTTYYTFFISNHYSSIGLFQPSYQTEKKHFSLTGWPVSKSSTWISPPTIIDTLLDSLSPGTRIYWSPSSPSASVFYLVLYELEQNHPIADSLWIPIQSIPIDDTTSVIKDFNIPTRGTGLIQVIACSSSDDCISSSSLSRPFSSSHSPSADVQLFTFANSQDTFSQPTPLPNVSIDFFPIQDGDWYPTVQTNSKGILSKRLQSGLYTLRIQKPGYHTQNITYQLLDTLSADSLSIYLTPSASKIQGRIASTKNLGIANAEITISSSTPFLSSTATTDSKGNFSLDLSPGAYQLSISHPQFTSPPDTSFTLSSNQTLFFPQRTLEEKYYSISGYLTNSKNIGIPGGTLQIKFLESSQLHSLGTIIRTDITGFFHWKLPPGSYQIEYQANGFFSTKDTLQITHAKYWNKQLNAATVFLEGTIQSFSYPDTFQTVHTYSKNAQVQLTPIGSTEASQTTIADASGYYSFPVFPGNSYQLEAFVPNQTNTVSKVILIPSSSSQSTHTQNLSLKKYAQITGNFQIIPSTTTPPSYLPVQLFHVPTSQVIQSQWVPYQDSSYPFSFQHVPNGEYKVFSGTNDFQIGSSKGLGLSSEPHFFVTNYVWPPTLQGSLDTSAHQIDFDINHTQTIPGYFHIISPEFHQVHTDSQLINMPNGSYSFQAYATDSTYIFLKNGISNYSSSNDTTIQITLPFRHFSNQNTVLQDTLLISIDTLNGFSMDSGYIHYNFYGQEELTRKIPILSNHTAKVPLKKNSSLFSEKLTYAPVLYNGTNQYGAPYKNRSFHHILLSSGQLADIHIEETQQKDTLFIPTESSISLHLHCRDIQGSLLDSTVIQQGTISWSLPDSAKSMFNISDTNNLSPTITSLKNEDIASNPIPLYLVVTLNAQQKEDTIWLVQANQTVHQLSLTSSLGNHNQVLGGSSFSITPIGLDTTVDSSYTLIPKVHYELIPPQAGSIDNNTIHLSSHFVGPLRIKAIHHRNGYNIQTELFPHSDSLYRGINVGQTLFPRDSSITFSNQHDMEITFPDSSLLEGELAVLRLWAHSPTSVPNVQLQKSLQSTPNKNIEIPFYEWTHTKSTPFNKIPTIRIAKQNHSTHFDGMTLFSSNTSVSQASALQRRTASSSSTSSFSTQKWNFLSDSTLTPSFIHSSNGEEQKAWELELPQWDGLYYSRYQESKPLSVSDLHIIPNPFSPRVLAARDGNTQYGTRISFTAHNDQNPTVQITLYIVNTAGELIRTLTKNQQIPKGYYEIYWDGKTNSNSWARNGRYFLITLVKNSNQQKFKKYIKPIVLFK